MLVAFQRAQNRRQSDACSSRRMTTPGGLTLIFQGTMTMQKHGPHLIAPLDIGCCVPKPDADGIDAYQPGGGTPGILNGWPSSME